MKKVIEINWKDEQEGKRLSGTVTLKRLSFREKNLLEEEATEIKIIGGQPSVKVSSSKLKELSILKSIESVDLKDEKAQVVTLDVTGIGNLPDEVGMQLFEAASELNSVSVKKNI